MRQNPRLSQVWLTDAATLELIATAVDISGKRVIEIGPGTGNLTKWLLAQKPKKLTAIEMDERLVEHLHDRFPTEIEEGTLEVVHSDVLKVDLGKLKAPIAFGNLPYHLSTDILLQLFHTPSIKKMLLVVQKEFAERLAVPAGHSNYSRLSVLTQNLTNPFVEQVIPRSAFRPEPEVDSALISLVRKPPKQVKTIDSTLVALLFQHKKQAVRNALVHSRRALNLEKNEVRDMVDSKVPQTLREKRPFELNLDELEVLSKMLALDKKTKKKKA